MYGRWGIHHEQMTGLEMIALMVELGYSVREGE